MAPGQTPSEQSPLAMPLGVGRGQGSLLSFMNTATSCQGKEERKEEVRWRGIVWIVLCIVPPDMERGRFGWGCVCVKL